MYTVNDEIKLRRETGQLINKNWIKLGNVVTSVILTIRLFVQNQNMSYKIDNKGEYKGIIRKLSVSSNVRKFSLIYGSIINNNAAYLSLNDDKHVEPTRIRENDDEQY
jgi:hypothetical protein